MDVTHLVQTFALYAVPVLFAITLHEAAHGFVARHFGDMTAYAQGRVSLNPLRHVDLIGTIVVPLAILVLSWGTFFFGWAKPVPINYSALRHPRRDMAWVAAAGPLANLAMALGWAVLLKIAVVLPETSFTLPLGLMAQAGIAVNLLLMLLNLLPIPPLDGGRIVTSLLPRRAAGRFAKIEPWGVPILLLLLFTKQLSAVLSPLLAESEALIRAVVFL
jgi:Zn-dependent protease